MAIQRLPDFIIIGAAKCGTTSLAAALDQHESIAISSIKEPEFFCEGRGWNKGLEWYSSLFDSSAAFVGEASTSYTKFPAFPGVPEKIHSVIPEAKFIYIVRDPIDRFLSHHRMALETGNEHRSITRTVENLDDPQSNYYLNCSKYALQIDQYLTHFPIERFLFVEFSKLVSNTQLEIRRILNFLGVKCDHNINQLPSLNPSSRYRRLSLTGRVVKSIMGKKVLRRLPKGLTHAPVPEALLSLNGSKELTLAEALLPDTRRFIEISGLQVSNWRTLELDNAAETSTAHPNELD